MTYCHHGDTPGMSLCGAIPKRKGPACAYSADQLHPWGKSGCQKHHLWPEMNTFVSCFSVFPFNTFNRVFCVTHSKHPARKGSCRCVIIRWMCAFPVDCTQWQCQVLEQRCVVGLNYELTVHTHKIEIEHMLETVLTKALDAC